MQWFRFGGQLHSLRGGDLRIFLHLVCLEAPHVHIQQIVRIAAALFDITDVALLSDIGHLLAHMRGNPSYGEALHTAYLHTDGDFVQTCVFAPQCLTAHARQFFFDALEMDARIVKYEGTRRGKARQR